MANAKIFHVRLVRKEKNSDTWVEDSVVNQIAFVEGAGYDTNIDQLFKMFNDIVLPDDITIQYIHSWDAKSREGCPDSFLVSLGKEGYEDSDNSKEWFKHVVGTEKAESRKFYVYHKNCISSLKRKIWNESSLSKVEWTPSDLNKKANEQSKFNPEKPIEWWM